MLTSVALYTATGIIVGAAAGIAPGPLMALLVVQTLRNGASEGVKIALAPLITDLPIISASLFLMTYLMGNLWPIGLVSLIGSGYLGYLSWECITIQAPHFNTNAKDTGTLKKGVLVNLLNPHPYLFWLTVGAPLLLKLWNTLPWTSAGWLVGFYFALVGTKIVIALMVGQTKGWLNNKSYVWFNRLLGALLGVFAMAIARDGLRLIGIIE